MGRFDSKDQKQIYTPEEREMRAKLARKRFRIAIRLVVQNFYWMKEGESDATAELLTALKKTTKRKTVLNFREKILLRKPAESRTPDEKEYLVKILSSMKCFKMFPREVKNELACVAYFFYLPPNRVVVRQGHEARALYIVASGTVISEKTVWDDFLKEYKSVVVGELVPGNMFGEICLLHNVRRSTTIRTSTHCEFLYLKKRDFDNVLKQTVQQEWDIIMSAMSRFEYFNDWTPLSLRECCTLSRIMQFQKDETIYGDKTGLSNYAYFILKGKCRMIQYIQVTSKIINGIKKYKLYDDSIQVQLEQISESRPSSEDVSIKSASVLPDRPKQKKSEFLYKEDSLDPLKQRKSTNLKQITIMPNKETEKYFMEICVLSELECFGIGEDLKERRIVAMTPVTCLIIPMYYLMKNNKGNLWNRVRQFLNMQLPSKEAVFNEFNNNRKWLIFRRSMVEGCLREHKRPNNTTIHDVPLSLRAYENIKL